MLSIIFTFFLIIIASFTQIQFSICEVHDPFRIMKSLRKFLSLINEFNFTFNLLNFFTSTLLH